MNHAHLATSRPSVANPLPGHDIISGPKRPAPVRQPVPHPQHVVMSSSPYPTFAAPVSLHPYEPQAHRSASPAQFLTHHQHNHHHRPPFKKSSHNGRDHEMPLEETMRSKGVAPTNGVIGDILDRNRNSFRRQQSHHYNSHRNDHNGVPSSNGVSVARKPSGRRPPPIQSQVVRDWQQQFHQQQQRHPQELYQPSSGHQAKSSVFADSLGETDASERAGAKIDGGKTQAGEIDTAAPGNMNIAVPGQGGHSDKGEKSKASEAHRRDISTTDAQQDASQGSPGQQKQISPAVDDDRQSNESAVLSPNPKIQLQHDHSQSHPAPFIQPGAEGQAQTLPKPLRKKLFPRLEPPGRRGRDQTNSLEIPLQSFLREQPRADPTRRKPQTGFSLTRVLSRSGGSRDRHAKRDEGGEKLMLLGTGGNGSRGIMEKGGVDGENGQKRRAISGAVACKRLTTTIGLAGEAGELNTGGWGGRTVEYGQIVIMPPPLRSRTVADGIYGGTGSRESWNQSMYRVNEVERATGLLRKKSRRVASSIYIDDEVHDRDEGKQKKSRGKLLSARGRKKRSEIESEEMEEGRSLEDLALDTMNGGNGESADGERRRRTVTGGQHRQAAKAREVSPAPVLALRKAAESTFGVDFSSILRRHEESTLTAGTPHTKRSKRGSIATSFMTRSESRPNVRDRADETRSPAKFLPSAFGRMSKSPSKASIPTKMDSAIKEVDKGAEASVESPKESSDFSIYRRQINSIRDSVGQQAAASGLFPKNLSLRSPSTSPTRVKIRETSHAQAPPMVRNSIVSNAHSKTPSGVSAGSGLEDNFSDISSAVISDAQSVLMQRPRSTPDSAYNAGIRWPVGPAPTGPLPSLPEGVDVQLPATPRLSESSQRRPSLERSPGKGWNKTPTKYKLTPSEMYPAKRLPSPERRHATGDVPKSGRKPAALVRIQSANIAAFPSPPPSPDRPRSMESQKVLAEAARGDSEKDALDARTEKTKNLKARDLAKEKSLAARHHQEPEPPLPSMKATNGAHSYQGSIEKLIDAYQDSGNSSPTLQQNPLSLGQANAMPSLQGDADAGNRLSQQDFSPIIMVAEQEPFSLSPEQALGQSRSSQSDAGELATHNNHYSNNFGDDKDSNHASPPAATATAAGSDDLHAFQGRESTPSIDLPKRFPYRPISKHAAIPLNANPSSSLSDVHGPSPRSSYAELDLEARMAAMEKRNLLLEQAFLAVMDASASMSSIHNSDSGSQRGGLGGGPSAAAAAAGSLRAGVGGGAGTERFSNATSAGAGVPSSYEQTMSGEESNGSVSHEREEIVVHDRLCAGLERLLARHGNSRLSFNS